MRKLFASLFVLLAVSAKAQLMSFQTVDLTYFITNGFKLSLNTNSVATLRFVSNYVAIAGIGVGINTNNGSGTNNYFYGPTITNGIFYGDGSGLTNVSINGTNVVVITNGTQIHAVGNRDDVNRYGWVNTLAQMGSNTTLAYLVMGDSIAAGTISSGGSDPNGGPARIGNLLQKSYGYGGFFGIGVDTRMAFTTSATGVEQVPGSAFPWFTDYLRLTNNTGVITWTNLTAGVDGFIPANVLEVDYLSRSNYGTFKIQTNINYGPFTDVAGFTSVNSAGTTPYTANVIRITNASGVANFNLRLVGLSGTNEIVGVGFWNFTTNGCAIGSFTKGGLAISDAMQTTNLMRPIFKSWNPTLISQWWRDTPYTFQTNLNRWNDFSTNYIPQADHLMVGVFPINSTSGGTAASNNDFYSIQQNLVMRSNALNYGWAYFDSYSLLGGIGAGLQSLTNAIVRGLIDEAGNVHPTYAGQELLGNALWNWMGLDDAGALNWGQRFDWYAKRTNTDLYISTNVGAAISLHDPFGHGAVFASDPNGGGNGADILWIGKGGIGTANDGNFAGDLNGNTYINGTNSIFIENGAGVPIFTRWRSGGVVLGNLFNSNFDPGNASTVAINGDLRLLGHFTDRLESQFDGYVNQANVNLVLKSLVNTNVGFAIQPTGGNTTNNFQVQNSSGVVQDWIDQNFVYNGNGAGLTNIPFTAVNGFNPATNFVNWNTLRIVRTNGQVPNILEVSNAATGIIIDAIDSTGTFTGNGANLTNLAGGNVTGALSVGAPFATTGSNYFSGAISYATNQSQIQPDFNIPFQLMATNAAFTFLPPIHVDIANKKTVQTLAFYVYNSSGVAIIASPPANAHPIPATGMYITNVSRFCVEIYPDPKVGTNFYCQPSY